MPHAIVIQHTGKDIVIRYNDRTIKIGAPSPTPATSRQETITTESVTNADVVLADTLDFSPRSNASVSFYVNGVFQKQGVGLDYTIDGRAITYLADTGTAKKLKVGDTASVTYLS